MMNRSLAGCIIACSITCGVLHAEEAKELKPGAAVDYGKLAFFPKRWKDGKVDTKLHPWQGKEVVLLTTKSDLDGKTMARFLQRLDGGWKLYADLVGQSPRPFKRVAGKPTIAAVPDASLTAASAVATSRQQASRSAASTPRTTHSCKRIRRRFLTTTSTRWAATPTSSGTATRCSSRATRCSCDTSAWTP
jgi:hypothetical protein